MSESFERFNNGGAGLLPSTLLNLWPEAHERRSYKVTIKHIGNDHEIKSHQPTCMAYSGTADELNM